ncbi:hypothetical protein ACO2Q7_06325 [Rathayibacter sp. KR2-224]|uniref:hypothetical protein n=1 Tax=Rathayibacter sp. KR2-224 TaxID=3400913 RepID=UPI003BFCF94E
MKARVAASIVLALGLTAGMSGCTLLTPQDTLYIKESAHGVNGTVGKIDIRNAVIISDSKGTVGNLVVTFVNNEDKAHYLSVQHGSKTLSVAIPAYGVKKVGRDGATRVQFDSLDAKPGSLTDVYFNYAGVTGTQLQVPVLSSTFPGYEDYAPSK